MRFAPNVRGVALALSLAIGLATSAVAQAPIKLTHIHGLAYSPDGRRLIVPSHHGLAIHENGKWLKGAGPEHDYMGFAATARQIYSSGHPAPGSRLVNPFGLIRSRDGAKTWDKLGLEGETDFHLLATGWNTNAIYVWNPEPSSRMRRAGLHFTLNEGFSWKPARAAGLAGEPHAIAVHPDNAALVAAAMPNGAFVSDDAGESFRAVASGESTTVFYDLDGKHLWYGSYDSRARLARLPLGGGAPVNVELPPLKKDAVAYIAQNPAARSEYAIATFGKNVYLSKDAGRTWVALALNGVAK